MKKSPTTKRKCSTCHKAFTPTREWQIFCGARCRNKFHKGKLCFYCGYTATVRDHIFPAAHRPIRPHTSPLSQRAFSDETVPACTECNSLLHTNEFPTIEERLTFLASRYGKKYKVIYKTLRPFLCLENPVAPGLQLKLLVREEVENKARGLAKIEYILNVRAYYHLHDFHPQRPPNPARGPPI